ncbi:MAG TPA: hypothetical protein VM123_10735 [archaeon]|nr:hypothetical protein [archaeon]
MKYKIFLLKAFFPLITVLLICGSCKDKDQTSLEMLGVEQNPNSGVLMGVGEPVLSSNHLFLTEEERQAFIASISKCDTIFSQDFRADPDNPSGSGVTMTLTEGNSTVRVRYEFPKDWEGIIIYNDPEVEGLIGSGVYRSFTSIEKLRAWQASKGPECYPPIE